MTTLQADTLRLILEQTYAVAQAQGQVELLDDHTSTYVGQEQTITYDSSTDRFSVADNSGDWKLSWQEGTLTQDSTPPAQEQAVQFEALQNWLNTQTVPPTPANQVHEQAIAQWQQAQADPIDQSQRAAQIEPLAQQLFEYYVEHGEPTYQLPDRAESFLQVEVDNTAYLISRDDTTGIYNITREGTDLDLQKQQGITAQDVQTWRELGEWMTAQQEHPPLEPDTAERTEWDEQVARSNQILPVAERAYAYWERGHIVTIEPERAAFVASGRSGEYIVGYQPITDTLFVERDNGERLVAATDSLHHHDRVTDTWQLAGLTDFNITSRDLEQFAEIQIWLEAKDRAAEREPNYQLSAGQIDMNRSALAAEARGQTPEHQEKLQQFDMSNRQRLEQASSPVAPIPESQLLEPVSGQEDYDFDR